MARRATATPQLLLSTTSRKPPPPPPPPPPIHRTTIHKPTGTQGEKSDLGGGRPGTNTKQPILTQYTPISGANGNLECHNTTTTTSHPPVGTTHGLRNLYGAQRRNRNQLGKFTLPNSAPQEYEPKRDPSTIREPQHPPTTHQKPSQHFRGQVKRLPASQHTPIHPTAHAGSHLASGYQRGRSPPQPEAQRGRWEPSGFPARSKGRPTARKGAGRGGGGYGTTGQTQQEQRQHAERKRPRQITRGGRRRDTAHRPTQISPQLTNRE
jgi:hypothetical protein